MRALELEPYEYREAYGPADDRAMFVFRLMFHSSGGIIGGDLVIEHRGRISGYTVTTGDMGICHGQIPRAGAVCTIDLSLGSRAFGRSLRIKGEVRAPDWTMSGRC